jgi:hypothetical protein
MNYDIADQLIQLRSHDIHDYHPPILAGGYWRILEFFTTGPFPLLLLQSSLFIWGINRLLCLRFEARRAAWITACVVLFPPILTPMAVIWKDAQMAAFLVAGTALVLAERRSARFAGIVALSLAAGVRYNGGAALPTLALLAISSWTSRTILLRIGLVAALLVALYVPTAIVNRLLTDHKDYNWSRTTAIFDIVGIVCYAPPLSDNELSEVLEGIKLTEHANLQKRFCDEYPPGKRNWYSYANLFVWHPTATDRKARRRAWFTLVQRFPAAYAQSRLQYAADVLGLIPEAWIWEPVSQDFAANTEQLRTLSHDHKRSTFQTAMGDGFRWIALKTPLYHPWIYAVVSLVILVWALYGRDLFVACIVGSGLLYELSILLLANAPDFRYSHWMIVCTSLGAVFVFERRWNAGGSRNRYPTPEV